VPSACRVRGPLDEPVELEVPVALDARVGRATLGVAGHVGVDHVGLEFGNEVEDVVDQTELVGNPSGIVDVGHRAAARVGLAAPQFEGGPDHVGGAVGLGHQRCRHRRVDTTGHGHQDAHVLSFAGG
jgi:hypothetical protein